jgi:DNA-directed RNA polymerase subunit beta'
MAVHIPLSPEAQIEASVLMMSSNNVLSPANGAPIAVPSQDIVLGCYYLTKARPGAKGEGRVFGNTDDVLLALEAGEVETLTPIRLRHSGELMDLTVSRDDQGVQYAEVQQVGGRIINTTVGRVIFNDSLPKGMPYINGLLKKKGLQQLVQYGYLRYGLEKTVEMLDSLKSLGFTYATKSGLSIGVDDLIIPQEKVKLVQDAHNEVIKVEGQYLEGAITNGERRNKVIAIWSDVTEKIADEMFSEMQELDRSGKSFNPVYIMADSGARGSKQQIRQLAGMRGLMAKPSGEIIETPITSNFREGLNVIQYFISTHGARKGLADTALKTADSGYLTRRLVDVAQDVIIQEIDCGTMDGIEARAIIESGEIIEPLRDRIIGRVTLERITDPFTGDGLVDANQEMNEELATDVQEAGIEKVKIRSVLTCASRRGVCAKCYGRDLATGRLVELGLAAGVIAAQSIGEPGTQLTMRTFHIGGAASRVSEQSTLEARHAGTVRFQNVQTVEGKHTASGAIAPAGLGELIVMNRTGSLVIVDPKGRDRERYPIVYGARLKVKDGQEVEPGQVIVEWDPYTFSILTEGAGSVHFKDIIEGLTVHEELDEVTGLSRLIIVDSPDEKKQPTIEIRDKAGKVVNKYHMPSHAHLMVQNGEQVFAGDVLAKIPRETTKTKDITGGLPRVVELFEARKPRETAVISEIDGIVKHGGIVKGQRKIIIVPEEPGAEPREYSLPRGVHVNVQEGDRVRAGEPLMDGPSNPHDILAVLGEKALQSYLVNEIQEVYRLQGVNINDKHIEVIVRQMMRWVKVEDVGDTEFLVDEQVDRFRFLEENERVIAAGLRPATGRPLLLGITKASLSTDSFISAASFQETTRVLTEASISGRVDHLRGLKENVTMGRLIPAGTGFEYYRQVRIPHDEPPPPPPPSPEELELEREMEYLVEPDETFGREEVGE